MLELKGVGITTIATVTQITSNEKSNEPVSTTSDATKDKISVTFEELWMTYIHWILLKKMLYYFIILKTFMELSLLLAYTCQ